MRPGADPRSRPRSSPQRLHELAERVAARLEVAELVEARTCGREEDDVAGCSGCRGPAERRREVTGANELDAGVREGGRDLVGRFADQICAVAVLERGSEGLVRLALATPAEDDVEPLVRERRERTESRSDVRRLGVVD